MLTVIWKVAQLVTHVLVALARSVTVGDASRRRSRRSPDARCASTRRPAPAPPGRIAPLPVGRPRPRRSGSTASSPRRPGSRRRSSPDSCSAIPTTARRPPTRPKRGSPTTRPPSTSPSRAMDPEPAQDRRSPDAARRAIAVRLGPRHDRFVPRQAQRVRVRGQPGRRQAGRLLVQRRQLRRGLGRGVGRVGHARRRTAGAPSSAFRSRSCASSRPRPRTFGLAFVRQIGRLNETSTWPLLSKNATGYVSSFGELTGLRLDRSPKRLEMVPYLVGDVDPAAGRSRQQPDEGHRSRRSTSAST